MEEGEQGCTGREYVVYKWEAMEEGEQGKRGQEYAVYKKVTNKREVGKEEEKWDKNGGLW